MTLIENSPSHSINYISYVITQTLPRGQRALSPNRREFFSNYFSPQGGFDLDGTERRERAFAHVIVLGDRRPFRTEIYVILERKDDTGNYRRVGMDKKLANELAAKIKAELAKSREDRNFIDDFRAF